MKKLMFAAALLGVAVGASFAQEIRVNRQIFGSAHGEIVLPTFDVITANGAVDAKQVKGAPFAAEFSSENVQTLADGNRIVRSSVSQFYRDNDGRTRREQTLGALNSLFQNGSELNRQVYIYDPIAKNSYSLNAFSRTAFRAKIFSVTVNINEPPGKSDSTKTAAGKFADEIKFFPKPGLDPEITKRFNEAIRNTMNRPHPETREESLGARDIEGVTAEGKRVTTVLPAGLIGNERPIEIVRETWFSKELGMIVLSQTKNPMTGEQTYKLTKLTRGEQPRQLFEVPADYKIVDGANLLNNFYFKDAAPANGETPLILNLRESSEQGLRLRESSR